jgi:hypothetical protein
LDLISNKLLLKLQEEEWVLMILWHFLNKMDGSILEKKTMEYLTFVALMLLLFIKLQDF